MEYLRYNGIQVAARDYEAIKRLERIAFNMTAADDPEGSSHRKATRVALRALEFMRTQMAEVK